MLPHKDNYGFSVIFFYITFGHLFLRKQPLRKITTNKRTEKIVY